SGSSRFRVRVPSQGRRLPVDTVAPHRLLKRRGYRQKSARASREATFAQEDWSVHCAPLAPLNAPMGVKVLHCFPWSRSSKDRGKAKQNLSQRDMLQEAKSSLQTPLSWDSNSRVQVPSRESRPVCFTHKASISLRHQMDAHIVDATN
ncbi:hypothetical protein Z043_108555, partial [Scleropages formosus]